MITMERINFYKETSFKDTEIGRIAEDWKIVMLDEKVDILDKYRMPLKEQERKEKKGVYPYCGANGIIDYINEYIFDGEYVLFAEDGGYFEKFEKSAYLMKGKFWANNHVHILQAKNGLINLFLYYSLIYLDLTPYVVGSTRKKLNQSALKSIKIPFPPLEEQKAIAKVLKDFDDLLEIIDKQIKKLERIKKGLMNEYFTKGIFKHEKFKNTEIGSIPEAWEIVKVKDCIYRIISKKGLKENEIKTSGKYPIISQGKEKILGFTDNQKEIINEDLPLIVFGDHTCEVKYVNFPFAVGGEGVKLLKPLSDIYPLFFYYALKKFKPKAEHYRRHFKLLKDRIILLPSLEEQKAIAERLKAVDDLIETKQKEKEHLERAKKKVMDLLLSGKVRIKN